MAGFPPLPFGAPVSPQAFGLGVASPQAFQQQTAARIAQALARARQQMALSGMATTPGAALGHRSQATQDFEKAGAAPMPPIVPGPQGAPTPPMTPGIAPTPAGGAPGLPPMQDVPLPQFQGIPSFTPPQQPQVNRQQVIGQAIAAALFPRVAPNIEAGMAYGQQRQDLEYQRQYQAAADEYKSQVAQAQEANQYAQQLYGDKTAAQAAVLQHALDAGMLQLDAARTAAEQGRFNVEQTQGALNLVRAQVSALEYVQKQLDIQDKKYTIAVDRAKATYATQNQIATLQDKLAGIREKEASTAASIARANESIINTQIAVGKYQKTGGLTGTAGTTAAGLNALGTIDPKEQQKVSDFVAEQFASGKSPGQVMQLTAQKFPSFYRANPGAFTTYISTQSAATREQGIESRASATAANRNLGQAVKEYNASAAGSASPITMPADPEAGDVISGFINGASPLPPGSTEQQKVQQREQIVTAWAALSPDEQAVIKALYPKAASAVPTFPAAPAAGPTQPYNLGFGIR